MAEKLTLNDPNNPDLRKGSNIVAVGGDFELGIKDAHLSVALVRSEKLTIGNFEVNQVNAYIGGGASFMSVENAPNGLRMEASQVDRLAARIDTNGPTDNAVLASIHGSIGVGGHVNITGVRFQTEEGPSIIGLFDVKGKASLEAGAQFAHVEGEMTSVKGMTKTQQWDLKGTIRDFTAAGLGISASLDAQGEAGLYRSNNLNILPISFGVEARADFQAGGLFASGSNITGIVKGPGCGIVIK